MESCCFPCDQVPESDCRDLFYSQARQCDESGLPPREALAWIVFTFFLSFEANDVSTCIIHVTVDDVSPVQGTRVMRSISSRAFARSALSREKRLHRHGPTYQCRRLWIIGKLINLKWKTSLLKGMMLTLRAGLFLKRLVPCKTMWCICQAARYWLRSPQPSITPPPAKQSFLLLASQEGDGKCQRCFLGCFSYRPPPPPPPVPPMPCGGNPDWLSD